jgi:hypothetical protein
MSVTGLLGRDREEEKRYVRREKTEESEDKKRREQREERREKREKTCEERRKGCTCHSDVVVS